MTQCYRVGPFIIGKKLGEGVCGKCYLGFHEPSGVKVAIKIVDKKKIRTVPEMKRKVCVLVGDQLIRSWRGRLRS